MRPRGVVVFLLFMSFLRPSSGHANVVSNLYFLSKDSQRKPFCFLDTPSAVFDGVCDRLSCLLKHCMPDPLCMSTNYHEATGKCELFYHPSMQSLNITDQCKNYQNANSPTAVDYCKPKGTGPAFLPQCCSFPFTYQGGLHYSCVNQGCYRPQHTWVTCNQSIGFTASYVKTNFTVPSIVKPVETTFINGWLIIHFNAVGPVDVFKRPWVEYRDGFGDLAGTYYWYGNEKVFQLTNRGNWKLRVEVQSADNGKWYSAEFESFRLSNEASKYVLNVSGYSGDAGDAFNKAMGSLHVVNGMNFSTFDSDNDNYPNGNCALNNGWWWNHCGTSILTDRENKSSWYTLKSLGLAPSYSVSTARMMIRPNY